MRSGFNGLNHFRGCGRAAVLGLAAALGLSACSSDDSTAAPADTTQVTDDTTGTTDDTTGTDGTTEDTSGTDGADGQDGASGDDLIISAPDTSVVEDTAAVVAVSCREAVLCQMECDLGDTACAAACAEGASDAIVTPLTAFATCSQEKCNLQVKQDQRNCAVTDCWEPFHACFYEGTSGAVNCEDTLTCFKNCLDTYPLDTFAKPPIVPECETACLQAADKQSQLDFAELGFCVANFCESQEDISPTALENCQKNAPCGLFEQGCINPN
jgi:hypothetical protein